MNSRNQFLRTINHRQPDRIVIDLGSTAVTGIHIHALSRLRRHYGLQRKPIRVTEPFQMLGEVSWELIDAVGIDVLGIWPENNVFGFNNYNAYKEWKTPWGQRVMVPRKFNVEYNQKGDVLMPFRGDATLPAGAAMPGTGYAFEVVDPDDFSGDTGINPTTSPDEWGLLTDSELEHWQIEIDKAYFSGKAVMVSLSRIAPGMFTMVPGIQPTRSGRISKITDWYNQNNIQSGRVKNVFEQQTEIAIENLRRIFSVAGNKINAVYLCGTDFGPDASSVSTTEQFEADWVPVYKQINDWIHAHTQWKTFKHSYSLKEPLAELFLRAGFDMINPTQGNGTAAELKKLKEKFGNDLVFWGVGIDTKYFLPTASPLDIKERILRNCEILAKNGGFIFSPDHNIPANVPVENIVAILDALQEFNGRP